MAFIKRFTYVLSEIELIPWDEGSFDVSVGGMMVHSMMREGGFPENETIIEAVKERLNAA